MKQLEREIAKKPKKVLKESIAKQMEDIGYLKKVQSDGHTSKWEITQNLVERFASLIFAEEIKKLPEVSKTRPGASPVTQGYYEKGVLRTIDEESRMDIVDSMVAARMNHPRFKELDDSDIMVKRDIHGTGVHVVIMFDKSGSMDENKRLDAAKRAVMALYKAIKQHNPHNVVDIVAFDTRAELVSLMDVWDCEPKGFTNTGEAVRIANDLLNESRVDRRMVYLVTDGLPEAYRKGDDFLAGDTDKAMDYTLKNIKPLKKYKNLRFILLLMEPEEDVYIDAAKQIADEIDGKIITTDPQKLATDLLVDYVGY
jgi:Mg-chelatase subunit ChlD